MGTTRSYGDACRFAHALDVVGERWALLVVRELLLGPKRFTDLRTGLPNASTNILSERLRELEDTGVVQRRKLPPPIGAKVYELTEWGRELEPIVIELGAWGAKAPVPPAACEIGTDSAVLALAALFSPEVAGERSESYAVRIGEEHFRVDVDGGEIELGRNHDGEVEATIELDDAAVLVELLTGRLALDEALGSGAMRLEGTKKSARRFLALFPSPEPCRLGATAPA